ncbi:MAG: hypothetical protein HKN94_11175 [Acidimicrobiales bacterium]|nr:hypothetical protein [Acidimicrobiales bacterium]RZV42677.1 MAG: hypothetical protein EX269_14500 [Acidimicrobiales bacterium]
MDRHVAWLKRVALTRTLVRLTLEAVLVGDLSLLALLATGTDRWVAIPWALVAGVVFAIVRFTLALHINPVGYGFLKRFSEQRINHQIEVPLDLVEPTIEATAASFFGSVNMHWLATVDDDAGWTTRLQLYRTDDRVIIGAVADDGSEPMFVSRLEDGRIVVSSKTFIPFRRGLIANMVRRGRLRKVLESHVDALDLAIASGAELGRVEADAIIHVLTSEQDSWTQLGPFVGPFVSVSAKWRPHLLQTRFSPSRMLEMSIAVPPERPTMHLPTAQPEDVDDWLEDSVVAEEPAVAVVINDVLIAEETTLDESLGEIPGQVIEQTAVAITPMPAATLPEPEPLWPLPEPTRQVEPLVEPEPVEDTEPVAEAEPVEAVEEAAPADVLIPQAPEPMSISTLPAPAWATTSATPLVIGRRAERDAA